jgi:chemotaxis protein histidine kinase CheA
MLKGGLVLCVLLLGVAALAHADTASGAADVSQMQLGSVADLAAQLQAVDTDMEMNAGGKAALIAAGGAAAEDVSEEDAEEDTEAEAEAEEEAATDADVEEEEMDQSELLLSDADTENEEEEEEIEEGTETEEEVEEEEEADESDEEEAEEEEMDESDEAEEAESSFLSEAENTATPSDSDSDEVEAESEEEEEADENIASHVTMLLAEESETGTAETAATEDEEQLQAQALADFKAATTPEQMRLAQQKWGGGFLKKAAGALWGAAKSAGKYLLKKAGKAGKKLLRAGKKGLRGAKRLARAAGRAARRGLRKLGRRRFGRANVPRLVRPPEDVEDCVACQYVWKQVEQDVGNAQITQTVFDSFQQNCIEAQKSPIFYPACQTMFDTIDDIVGDYQDGYTVNQLCENSMLCRPRNLDQWLRNRRRV